MQSRPGRPTHVLLALPVSLILLPLLACGRVAPPPIEHFRVPADHEPVDRLLLTWDDDLSPTLTELIALASPRMSTSVVVSSQIGTHEVRQSLEDKGLAPSVVTMIELPVEAPWMRDYGPMFAVGDGGHLAVLDFGYSWRPDADRVPGALAHRFWPGAKLVDVPVEFEGGNLITDGAGTCVVADVLYMDSDEAVFRTALQQYAGCTQILEVPALRDEPTGHVDMFVFSPRAGEFVVGSYTAEQDVTNKDVLDEAAIIIAESGLKVSRIPMPANYDGAFRTYTNLLVLDNLVLVPSYFDDSTEKQALKIISRAFPAREVIPIDASETIRLEGALHCLAQTVPRPVKVRTAH